jgi:hypothetical protein
MAALMADLGIMERALQLLSAAGRRAGKQQAANRASIAGSNAKLPNNTARATPRPVWMVTEARVTECRNELVRASALTLRITNGPTNKLTVSFTYYAHARLYYDNFISPVVRAQGDTFSVYYNALNPSENTQTSSGATKKAPRQISPCSESSSSRSSRSPWFEGRDGMQTPAHRISSASIHVRPTSGGARRNIWIHIVIPQALVTPPSRAKAQVNQYPLWRDVPY